MQMFFDHGIMRCKVECDKTVLVCDVYLLTPFILCSVARIRLNK